MLPWIIGGAVVLVAGAIMSSVEEEEKKKNERKLDAQRRRQESEIRSHRQSNRREKIRQTLRLLESERHRDLEQLSRLQAQSRHPGHTPQSRRKTQEAIELLHRRLSQNSQKSRELEEKWQRLTPGSTRALSGARQRKKNTRMSHRDKVSA
jgi:hypothetical protein